MDKPLTALDEKLPQAADQEGFLQTDQLLADLGGHSTRGGAVMMVSAGAQVMIGFAGTLVLARLLVPRDFGLVAMVASVMGFVTTIRDFGLPTATVQKRTLSHAHVSGLFWLNLKLSALMALVLLAMAPGIAWFYGESRLVAITLVMTAGSFALGVSTLHVGLLRRQMRFGMITAIDLGAQTTGVIVGIGAALAHMGFWALVLQQVAVNVVTAACLWIVCRWRPGPRRASREAADDDLRSMMTYGKYLTYSRAVGYVGKNIDVVLIGRFAGAAPAGLYQKAEQWATLPFQQVYFPILNVAVSTFSRLQHDPPRYRIYFRRALLGLFAITVPAMAWVFIDAREIILLLLGPKWAGAIPIFRALTIGAFAGSTGLVARWVYLAEGATKRQLNWALYSTPVLIAGVIAGLRWGAVGVAWGYALACCALAWPALAYCFATSVLQMEDFWRAVWRPTLISILAAGALLALRRFAPTENMSVILVRDFAFIGVIYLTGWIATAGGRDDLRELLALLRHLRLNKSDDNADDDAREPAPAEDAP